MFVFVIFHSYIFFPPDPLETLDGHLWYDKGQKPFKNSFWLHKKNPEGKSEKAIGGEREQDRAKKFYIHVDDRSESSSSADFFPPFARTKSQFLSCR